MPTKKRPLSKVPSRRESSIKFTIEPKEEQLALFARIWTARLLSSKNVLMNLLGEDDDTIANVFSALGLTLGKLRSSQLESNVPRRVLRDIYRLAKQEVPALPEPLSSNLVRIGAAIGLNDSEKLILALVAVISVERAARTVASLRDRLTPLKAATVISRTLLIDEASVAEALRHDGKLVRSGILDVKFDSISGLDETLSFTASWQAERLLTRTVSTEDLLDGVIKVCLPASLRKNDFGHIGTKLDAASRYLAATCMSGTLGVNILIYGKPGVGKSECARLIAQEAGFTLLEVGADCNNNDVGSVQSELPSVTKRLQGLTLAQWILASKSTLLLYDEAEDVFGDDGLGRELGFGAGDSSLNKAFLNTLLEKNRLPIIWITNHVEPIDEAYLRRFDMVLEIPMPPRSQREMIIRNSAGALLSQRDVERLAENTKLSPAVVSRAARVSKTIHEEQGREAGDLMLSLINETLKAQGHRAFVRSGSGDALDFAPELTNADLDLNTLVAGVERSRKGRICLFGPPGTGKSAFGKWLANRISCKVLTRRASDLLGIYVGETEQRIAAAFEMATQDGAVLVLDEIDSFLADRRQSHRSWEVTMVNEMLTQMEAFPGILVATTNLVHGLDQASLRRFDIKALFDYSTAEQAAELLKRYCKALDLPRPGESELGRVARLNNVTPGDFASVAHRAGLLSVQNVADLVDAIERECNLKETSSTRLGFV